jgi:hypothetical protein
MINSSKKKSTLCKVTFRELQYYSQEELIAAVSPKVNSEQIVAFIKKLKEYGILKTYKSEKKKYFQLAENENEVVATVVAGDKRYLYAFNFVGVLFVAIGDNEYLIKCYPKYIKDYEKDNNNAKFKTILRVLARFNKSECINIYGEAQAKDYVGRISVMLELINNYWAYGIYKNEKNIFEDNGSGEIDWNKTVDGTTAIIANNRPYYTNLQTRRTICDEYNYFTRLHKCILKDCTNELRRLDLFSLFGDLTPVELTDEILPDFGAEDYIDYKINNELNIQFNTQKQYLLRLMRAYLGINENYRSEDEFKMFGTTSFNLVWENVCKTVLSNCLEQRQKLYQNKTLKELIRKPKWNMGAEPYLADTLIPDLISVKDNSFYIFDAKYYDIEVSEGRVVGQPGLESITKQFLYELAYYNVDDNFNSDFFASGNITKIKNCFLFPDDGDGDDDIYNVNTVGYVSFDIFRGGIINKPLQNIFVRKVYAQKFYEAYLSGKQINIAKLKLA